jgi:hypothetical protein
MRLTPEREKEIKAWRSNNNKELGFVDILLAEIDALREDLKMAGNACGIAATFLSFHGRPSSKLNNCIEMIKNHERMALSKIGDK